MQQNQIVAKNWNSGIEAPDTFKLWLKKILRLRFCAITCSITHCLSAKSSYNQYDNPKDVRFEDACKAATMIGYEGKSQKGSHNAFSKPGEPEGLNFQNRGGKMTVSGKAAREENRRAFGPTSSRRSCASRSTGSTQSRLRVVVPNAEHYPVDVFYSEDDEGFIALARDLAGCSAFGETRAAAASEIHDAICAWIEAAESAGNPIPEPSKKIEEDDLPSGKILLRLPDAARSVG